MRLETLTIRGMLRFRDAVSIDLRTLPAGLIAVCGANGEGKTTIVESGIAALYRVFPSRAERELFDYATERDSHIEAVFAVEGRGAYRARVNLDPITRTSDAVLEQLLPNGSRAILNDGKVSTFDQAVAAVFPSREVLLASAVAAQNKAGSFITLDKKGRKDLFSRLLGLDHYEAMATTARTAVQFCEQGRLKLAATRDVIAAAAAPTLLKTIEIKEVQVAHEREQLLTRRAALTARIEALEQERAGLQAQATQHATAQAKLSALKEKADGLAQQLASLRQQQTSTVRQSRADEETLTAARTKRLADLDERITNNETLLVDADTIRAAKRTSDISQSDHDKAAAEKRILETARDAILKEHRRMTQLEVAQREAHAALGRAKDATAILDTVPCEGADGFADCQFLTRAIAAKKSIPDLEGKSAGLADTQRAIADQQTAYDGTKVDINTCDAHIRAAADQVAGLAPTVKKLPYVEQAEQRLVELRQERTAADTETAEQLTQVGTRTRSALADLETRLTTVTAMFADADAAIVLVQADVDASAGAHMTLAHLDVDLATARREWDTVTTTLARLEAMTEELARRRTAWEAAQAQVAEVETRLREVEQHGLEWQLLAKALGRDGLPVLEIDAAGPTVSSFTNDLLGVCFGPRFTVDLVTQQPKADGKGSKEVFELKVMDNLRGGDARDIGDLSGGEQILVDEALKSALALFVNSRNVAPIETCWRDETTGPLDPENATRYLEMLRRVQQIGGFHQILFVTHNASAAASAHAQLRVHDGRVTTALPPYAEAA